jgi:hypothetical protein
MLTDYPEAKAYAEDELKGIVENAGILTMYSQYKVTTGSQIKLTTPF